MKGHPICLVKLPKLVVKCGKCIRANFVFFCYTRQKLIYISTKVEINIEHIVQVRLFKTLLNMQQIRKGQMQLDNYYKISLIQLSCMCMDYNL